MAAALSVAANATTISAESATEREGRTDAIRAVEEKEMCVCVYGGKCVCVCVCEEESAYYVCL